MTEYEVYEDTSARMSAADVSTQKFITFKAPYILKGYTKSAFWIKVPFTEIQQTANQNYLLVLPANIIETSLFQYKDDKWTDINQSHLLRQLTAFAKRSNDLYKLPENSSGMPLLLKVTSASSLAVQLQIGDIISIFSSTLSLSTTLAYYFGIALFSLIFLAWMGIKHKDFFSLTIAWWIATNGLFRLLLAGLVPPSWLPRSDILAHYLIDYAIPSSYAFFLFTLFQEHNVSGGLKKIAATSVFIAIFVFIFSIADSDWGMSKLLFTLHLFPLLIMIALPFLPKARSKLGLPLVSSIFLLSVITFIFRTAVIGISPHLLSNFMLSNLQIPYFVLICVAGLSHWQKTRFIEKIRNEREIEYKNLEIIKENKRADQQRQFMLMLTHELKNSLSVMRLFVQSSPEHATFTPLAEQSINDIDNIIDRCLEADQLDRKAIKLAIQQIDVITLVNNVLPKNESLTLFSTHAVQQPYLINTDKLLLRTMLHNLVDNALRYSLKGSEIRIDIAMQLNPRDTTLNATGCLITISNLISIETIPNPSLIFDKYYRGPMANRTSGSGLGLYVVKSMSELLGGDLNCSITNNLVKFNLWLPH